MYGDKTSRNQRMTTGPEHTEPVDWKEYGIAMMYAIPLLILIVPLFIGLAIVL